MLSIVLLYLAGKQFYDLAEINNRQKWLFGILGVASYYVGTFLGGIVVALITLWMGTDPEELPNLTYQLLSIPFGVICAFGFYRYLRWQWTKQPRDLESQLLDSNLDEL